MTVDPPLGAPLLAGVPIVAVPLVKDALARHTAFTRSLADLRAMGVRVLFDPGAPPPARMPPWDRIVEELHALIEDRHPQ